MKTFSGKNTKLGNSMGGLQSPPNLRAQNKLVEQLHECRFYSIVKFLL